MRRIAWVAAVVASAVTASAALAAQVFPRRGNDSKATAIVERDWCDLARYDRARNLGHLSKAMRRNLFESEQVVRRRPWGCVTARDVAHGRHERIPRTRAPWVRKFCPHGALLPLRPGDLTTAAQVAAGAETRALRAVVWSVNRERRSGIRPCGRRAFQRTVVVGIQLTGYLPSASLSQRVVAVSHFRRWGWRTWLLLH